MSYYKPQTIGSFSDDAKKAIVENPSYFVRWYTIKSIGLCASIAYIAYLLGTRKKIAK